MLEKIKAVNNPLTIIAIFAALAEVAGTVALKLVSESSQGTFIWFVMLFPVLIVLLFFITLNFNPNVLYAPSDFKNEENFLTVIKGVNRLSINLEEVQSQLETIKTQIVDDAVQQLGVAGQNERSRLIEIVSGHFRSVQEKVESTRESAEEAIETSKNRFSFSRLKEKIMTVLYIEARPLTAKEITTAIKIEQDESHRTRFALESLIREGLIKMSAGQGNYSVFELNSKSVNEIKMQHNKRE